MACQHPWLPSSSRLPRPWCPRRQVYWIAVLLFVLASSRVAFALVPNNLINPSLQLRTFEYPDASRLLSPNETVGTFRTDFCDASYRVLVTKEIPLARALDGWALRTAVLESGNLAKFELDATGNFVGLDADYNGLMPLILDNLCQRAGCTWRNTFAAVSKKDLDTANRTFSDLLFWTTNVYDISIDFWSRSLERLQAGATFLEPWYDGSLIMVTKIPAAESDDFDPWAWLDPFDYSVWIMILVTLAFSTVIHWLIEVIFVTPDAEDSEEHSKNLWSLVHHPLETLWRFATAFTGQFEFEPTTGPAYLFTFSVAFWALLMSASYTANLASFLVIRNRPIIPVNTVLEAVQLDKRLCVQQGTQQDESVTRSFPVYAQSGRLIRIPGGGERAVLLAVRSDICDIAIVETASWNILQRDSSVNGNCDLEWIGRPLEPIGDSFSVKGDAGDLCTSLLRDVLNVHMIQMQMDGVLQELWNQHIARTASVDCNNPNTPSLLTDTAARRQLLNHNNNKEVSLPLSHDGSFGHHNDHFPMPKRKNTRGLQTTTSPLPRPATMTGSTMTTSTTTTTVAVPTSIMSTRLSLTNLGGVFLLHGLLSVFAVLCAGVSWAYHYWRNKKFWENHDHDKSNDQVENLHKDSKLEDPTTTPGEGHSLGMRHFLRQSRALEPEEASPELPNHHHHHDKHDIRRDFNRSFARRGKQTAAHLHALRNEVNAGFHAGDERSRMILQRLEAMEERFSRLEERLLHASSVDSGIAPQQQQQLHSNMVGDDHVVELVTVDEDDDDESAVVGCWNNGGKS